MTLSSLSTSDYRALEGLCDGLLEWCEPNKVSPCPCPPCGRTTSLWA